MVIQIESLEVENIGCFRGKHQLNLQGDAQKPEVVTGRGATGKTTLTNAIYLCLTGYLRNDFSPNDHRIEQLEDGDSVDSRVMSAIAFAAGMRYGADHVYYFYHASNAFYGRFYPEIPRTAVDLYDFAEDG